MSVSALLSLYVIRIAVHSLIFMAQIIITEKILAKMKIFSAKKLQSKKEKKSAPVREQLKFSCYSILIAGIAAVLMRYLYQRGWTQIYLQAELYSWWYFGFSILAYGLLFDAYFYFTHRFLHRPSLFSYIHSVHHRAENPNVYALYYFHPVEAAIYALAHILMILILPLHPLAVAISLIWIDLHNWFFHWGYDIYPRWFGRFLPFANGSSFHFQHHQSVQGNYGYFTNIWDRMLSTEKKPESP